MVGCGRDQGGGLSPREGSGKSSRRPCGVNLGSQSCFLLADTERGTLTLASTHIWVAQKFTRLILRHYFPGFRSPSETGANSFLPRVGIAHTLRVRVNLSCAQLQICLDSKCQVRPTHACINKGSDAGPEATWKGGRSNGFGARKI